MGRLRVYLLAVLWIVVAGSLYAWQVLRLLNDVV
jgi:hypothetical protein